MITSSQTIFLTLTTRETVGDTWSQLHFNFPNVFTFRKTIYKLLPTPRKLPWTSSSKKLSKLCHLSLSSLKKIKKYWHSRKDANTTATWRTLSLREGRCLLG